MILCAFCITIGSANALTVQEYQEELEKIETQESKIKYLEGIKQEILDKNEKEEELAYYKDLHWLYYENSIAEKAVATADILIAEYESQNNLKMKAKYLIYKSEDYILINDDYETAKLFVQEALNIANKTNNVNLKILSFANLATLESGLGYYFQALETLSKAEVLITESSEYEILRELYAEFTSVFSYMKNKEKGMEYNKKIIKLYEEEKINKGFDYIITLYNISIIIEKKKEKLELYKKIKSELNNPKISEELYNIASLYEIMARLDIEEKKSLEYINKSIDYFEKNQNTYEVFLSKKTKIELLLKRYKSEEALEVINSLSEENKKRVAILKMHSEAYENLGESEISLQYAMQYQQVYEESFNKVFVKTVKDLRNMFQTVEKEKENTRLLKETREKQEKIRDEQLKLEQKERFIMLSYLILIVIFSLCIVSILAYRRIKIKATIDELTKVYNRKTIQKIADKIFNNNRSKPLSVIFFDIDFFKKVNDQFGHQAGDVVLQTVSSTVKKTLRKEDKVGRFGGEEFVIISKSSVGITEKMAERLRKEIMKLRFDNYPDIKITASFGVSSRQSSDENVSEVIKRADDKLYEAKENGRNIVIK